MKAITDSQAENVLSFYRDFLSAAYTRASAFTDKVAEGRADAFMDAKRLLVAYTKSFKDGNMTASEAVNKVCYYLNSFILAVPATTSPYIKGYRTAHQATIAHLDYLIAFEASH